MSDPSADKTKVVIVSSDTMAMGTVEVPKAHNKTSVPVFGVDMLSEALALVKPGAMVSTVLSDANNQAKATLDLVRNLADGKGTANGTDQKVESRVIRVPYVGVDKDNLAKFANK